MIKEHKGDLLKNVNFGIICHGCNVQGVMGSGIAKLIKETYPKAFDAYYQRYTKYGLMLGEVIFYKENSSLYIANAITQFSYGHNKNVRYVDYEGIAQSFNLINRFALKNKIFDIHFPMIGAGLGNGDWEIISRIIDNELDDQLNKNLWIL